LELKRNTFGTQAEHFWNEAEHFWNEVEHFWNEVEHFWNEVEHFWNEVEHFWNSSGTFLELQEGSNSKSVPLYGGERGRMGVVPNCFRLLLSIMLRCVLINGARWCKIVCARMGEAHVDMGICGQG
jgi:hypothetical protein